MTPQTSTVESFSKTLQHVKENQEDFEWYPTTSEMVRAIFEDVEKEDIFFSAKEEAGILDIGAGNGSFFEIWDRIFDEKYPKDKHGYRPNCIPVPYLNYYAIEKSQILIEAMPKNIIIVGTDFHENTLIDKKMFMNFSNPPFSEFIPWSVKTIMESNSKFLYLIIPERWSSSGEICNALAKRKANFSVIFSGDFLNAKRAARAKIDIIKIDFRGNFDESSIENIDPQHRYYFQESWDRSRKVDPFDLFFEENFPSFDKHKVDLPENENTEKSKTSLLEGANLVERLEILYRKDLDEFQNVFAQLSALNPILLKEIDVSRERIKSILKLKIEGLKSKYWKELFDNLNKITDRLTSNSRKKLLEKLNSNLSVDFSAANAYAVVLWAVKHSNEYYDIQLCDCYENLVNADSVKLYKSNDHFIKDDWRFATENSHYYLNDSLEYRIVTHRVGGIYTGSWSYESQNGLEGRAYDYIQDILTIAKNLGYEAETTLLHEQWETNQMKTFYFHTNENSIDVKEKLFTVRAFMNGNLHFKFNQNFLRKWNVEFGRIKNWINTPVDASNEMGIPVEEIHKFFKSNHKIIISNKLLLEHIV